MSNDYEKLRASAIFSFSKKLVFHTYISIMKVTLIKNINLNLFRGHKTKEEM